MEDLPDSDVFQEIEQNNYEKIQQKLSKAGYADGANDGRNAVFQEGFDLGYADGLKTGLQLEKIKSFYENLKETEATQPFMKEKLNFISLNLEEAKSREHYQYLKNMDLSLLDVSKKQLEYCDSLKIQFKQSCPSTMNLLGD